MVLAIASELPFRKPLMTAGPSSDAKTQAGMSHTMSNTGDWEMRVSRGVIIIVA